jgi:glycerol uptake facilitator-like aquaporin
MKAMNRFALLAILGAVVGSAVVAGCGGDNTETTETTTENANGTTTTKTETTTED